MSFLELLEVALAGTQRHAPPATVFSEDDPEARLLRGASLEGLRRLAGQRLADAPPVAVTAAPAEVRPLPPRAAVARLDALLEDREELIEEWLMLANERGLRVPHAALVELLELGREDRRIAALVQAVGGERAAWLGQRNPDWTYAARVDPEQAFSSGTRAQRVRGLEELRRHDARRARELLAQAWEQEDAEARAALLAALEDGLSPEDEPLLHVAIGEHRKDVREVALRLVRRVPNAAFGERWAKRAREHVVVDAQAVTVCPPAELDSTWAADGVDPKPPKTFGNAAWWLRQMMAFTPPSLWPTASFVSALEGTDWFGPLVSGLAEAAAAYADVDWCQTLLDRWLRAGAGRGQLGFDPTRLLRALRPQAAEAALERAFDIDDVAFAQLLRYQHHWSTPFSDWFMRQVPRMLKRPYVMSSALHQAALRMDPSLAHAAPVIADQPLLTYLADTLEYRSAMRREFA